VQVQVALSPAAAAERAPLLRLHALAPPHATSRAEREEAGALSDLEDGTCAVAFELYEGVYNAALHRAVSVLICKPEALAELRAALERDRFANANLQAELDALDAVGNAVAGMHQALAAPPNEPELLAQLDAAGRGEADAAVAAAAATGTDDRASQRRRRLQCAAHLRSTERRILRSHMDIVANSIRDLRGIVEEFVATSEKSDAEKK
jgi:hypothetical protein